MTIHSPAVWSIAHWQIIESRCSIDEYTQQDLGIIKYCTVILRVPPLPTRQSTAARIPAYSTVFAMQEPSRTIYDASAFMLQPVAVLLVNYSYFPKTKSRQVRLGASRVAVLVIQHLLHGLVRATTAACLSR